MELDDLNLDIKIEVTSIEELREIRREMQKIAKSKKEIELTSGDIVDAADAVQSQGLTDEEFSTVGGLEEDKFNDRRM